MRCSDCSAKIKPVVAIDIDGTLADYHTHFIAFLEKYLGFKVMRQYQGGEPFKEWVMEFYRISERTWHDIKLAYRQGAQKRSAPAYPYARWMTERVFQEAELWLTTTRPYLRLDNVDPDTRFWLDNNDICFDHLLYDKDKYGVLAERVDPERVAAVLDDLPYQYDRAEQLFGARVPILAKTAWNTRDQRINQVSGLEYAEKEIISRLQEWREAHESESIGTRSSAGHERSGEHRAGDSRPAGDSGVVG